jgi:hypothetical protein
MSPWPLYIAHHGEAEAEKWLAGVKDNLARKAGGGDRDVARTLWAVCVKSASPIPITSA